MASDRHDMSDNKGLSFVRAQSDEPGSTRRRKTLRSRSRTMRSQSANDLTRDDRGWTPLHVASHTGSFDQVKVLLAEGMDVNEQSTGPKHPGATALHLAAASGHVDVMDLLLEHGANIEARTRGSFGWTPLHLAAKGNRREAVKFLVECGAFLAPDINDLRFNPPTHYCRGRGLEYAYECTQDTTE